MSIRLLMRIKNIIKQSKQETVSSTYWQRDDFLPEKLAQNIQCFTQNGSNDGQCPTTDSPSSSYANADRKDDSVLQNSNRLSETLKTLIMCQFGIPTEPYSKSTLCIALWFTVPKLYIIIFLPFKQYHQRLFYRKVSVQIKIQVPSWC